MEKNKNELLANIVSSCQHYVDISFHFYNVLALMQSSIVFSVKNSIHMSALMMSLNAA